MNAEPERTPSSANAATPRRAPPVVTAAPMFPGTGHRGGPLLQGPVDPARAVVMLYSAAGRSVRSSPRPDPQFHAATHETRNERPVNVLDEIVSDQLRTDLPELASGDTVKVSAKVVEGNRERIQVFEGIVMRLRGGGITRSITVRRIASGVGVERTFKIHSPRIEKIEVVRHGQVRRAQLYFLRKRVGKAATLRERRTNR